MNESKDEIKLLHDKIDLLNSQVASLTSWIKPIEELKEDIGLFSTDAFNEIIKFLSDIDFHFRSQDFLFLIKKLLINVKNLAKMMDMIQSATEFMEDTKPLAKEIVNEIIETMHQFEQYRLFDSLKMMIEFPIKWNQNFTPEEIRQFTDGMIKFAKLFTRISSPENLAATEKIMDLIESADRGKKAKVSLFGTLRKLASKEVLRKLNLVLDAIKLL